MKQIKLLFVLTLVFTFTITAQAQRKGLVFDNAAYQKVPLADDEKMGYSDETLPAAVSYKQYAPYAGNQGDYGTCVGWSTAYGALTMEYAMKMGITNRKEISFAAFCPYYIYNQFKDETDYFCQGGGLFEDALDIMFTSGAKRYYLPEYSCYSTPDSYDPESAKAFKINDYYRLFDWEESEFDKVFGVASERVQNIKKALAAGHPVLIGAYVPPSFDLLKGKDLWVSTQAEKDSYNTHGGHAMVIVGYDDNKYGGAFEILNSWGTEWGNQGFIWAKYDDVDIFGHTAFYIDLGYKYYPAIGCQLGDCTNSYSKYKFSNNETYEGELKNGLFDGMGIYFWADGSAYSGEWKGGLKHGRGILLNSYGTTTSGYWKDNNYYGTSAPPAETVVTPVVPVTPVAPVTPTVTTTGCVSGDCNNGFGKFVYSDGDVYEGNFLLGYRHGFGKYIYYEGDVYDGIWSWNIRTGLGYYKWPSGNEYIGYWVDNNMEGLGTKYYASGTNEAGEWKAGVFQTSGTFGYSAAQEAEAVQEGHQSGTIFTPSLAEPKGEFKVNSIATDKAPAPKLENKVVEPEKKKNR
jgi:hypothetical protein